MKQIIQNYRTGRLELAEVPVPMCTPDTILVKNVASLVSIGTERSVIELAKKSLLGKAKARPDLVKRFLDKAKKEGYIKTFQEALGRLDNATPLGYSSAGVVIEVGANIHKISPGDRVACIGAGYASHAGYITVPENLCCKMPDTMEFEEASFAMLGIIALHGIRCSKLTFGSSVAVIGLGLLGLLTVQMLKAYGCRVIGTDIDPAKLKIAKQAGADDVVETSRLSELSHLFTNGMGVDAVIITAATSSDEPVNTAVEIARYGAKVVIVGVADIHPQRNEMWHKEVEIIVSKAGGPGTLDPFYENKGIDYPAGYIRWTENRNVEEFLRLIFEKKIDVKSLISHRFKIDDAESVYKDVMEKKGNSYIGMILDYPEESQESLSRREVLNSERVNYKPGTQNDSQLKIGVIGAGLFGKAILLPALKKIRNIQLKTIATSSSTNTHHSAKKYGFEKFTTDYKEIICDSDIDSVVILTPHSIHAKMVIEALNEGKHIFVEKPLCVNEDELGDIIKNCSGLSDSGLPAPFLMVGYNRRFSPHATRMSDFLNGRQDPAVINYRVNSGYVPPDHWVHSEQEGGSRVIGEICHFVDMMQFLIRSDPVKVYAERISGNNKTILNSDNLAITLKFSDGSIGNILYTAAGDKAFSRERIEVFFDGKTITCDDYRTTLLYDKGKASKLKTSSRQMGYRQELQHFVDVITENKNTRINNSETFLSTLTVFKINESLDKGKAVKIIV